MPGTRVAVGLLAVATPTAATACSTSNPPGHAKVPTLTTYHQGQNWAERPGAPRPDTYDTQRLGLGFDEITEDNLP